MILTCLGVKVLVSRKSFMMLNLQRNPGVPSLSSATPSMLCTMVRNGKRKRPHDPQRLLFFPCCEPRVRARRRLQAYAYHSIGKCQQIPAGEHLTVDTQQKVEQAHEAMIHKTQSNDQPLPAVADWNEDTNRLLLDKLFSDDMPGQVFDNFAERFAVMLLRTFDEQQMTISLDDPDLKEMVQKIEREVGN
jgi:hypothetical protein